MAQQWTRLDARFPVRVHVCVVNKVTWHHVDGTLDTLEVAADGACEGTQQGRLSDADVTLQKHVTSRKDCDVQQPDERLLPNDGRADLGLNKQCPLTPILQLLLGSLRKRCLTFSHA